MLWQNPGLDKFIDGNGHDSMIAKSLVDGLGGFGDVTGRTTIEGTGFMRQIAQNAHIFSIISPYSSSKMITVNQGGRGKMENTTNTVTTDKKGGFNTSK